MPVTLKDIAQASGCAVPTVGFVLRGSPKAESFRPEVRQRILEIAEQLGYRPNWSARALATNRSYAVGALYLPMSEETVVIYQQMLNHAAKVLQGHHYHLLLCPLPDDESEWDAIVRDQRMDGWLVLNVVREALRDVLVKNKAHAVLLNAETDADLPRVVFDDAWAAAELTRHILEFGHRRVVFYLGEPGRHADIRHMSVDHRVAGYEQVMRQAGLTPDAWMLDPDGVVQRLRSEDRPTAIIAYTHTQAMELFAMLRQVGLRVPQDISVACFNDVYPVQYMPSPLTVMANPDIEMAEAGANLLLDGIAGRPIKTRTVTYKAKLIRRESVAAPPSCSA